MHAWNAHYLPGRHDDEEGAAAFAPEVGVDAVIGLLFAHELDGLVLAAGHVTEDPVSGFRRLGAAE